MADESTAGEWVVSVVAGVMLAAVCLYAACAAVLGELTPWS